MKRFVTVFLVLAVVCGAVAPAFAMDWGNLFGSLYNDTSSVMPRNITLPEEFSITYEYTEDGRYKEVTMEKDRNGNYHYKDNEEEYLFIKEGKGYRLAIRTVNGFVYKNTEKYTFDYIKTQTSLFWKCAEPLDDDITLGTTTEEGTGLICGRKTNKFKVDVGFGYSFGGYNVSMSEATYYEFDEETKICLASSSNEDISVMGMNSNDSGNTGFECVSFLLEDISLPSVTD